MRNRDRRYSIGREWCGYPEPRHVVRFCGEWVGQTRTRADALALADDHAADRERVLQGAA